MLASETISRPPCSTDPFNLQACLKIASQLVLTRLVEPQQAFQFIQDLHLLLVLSDSPHTFSPELRPIVTAVQNLLDISPYSLFSGSLEPTQIHSFPSLRSEAHFIKTHRANLQVVCASETLGRFLSVPPNRSWTRLSLLSTIASRLPSFSFLEVFPLFSPSLALKKEWRKAPPSAWEVLLKDLDLPPLPQDLNIPFFDLLAHLNSLWKLGLDPLIVGLKTYTCPEPLCYSFIREAFRRSIRPSWLVDIPTDSFILAGISSSSVWPFWRETLTSKLGEKSTILTYTRSTHTLPLSLRGSPIHKHGFFARPQAMLEDKSYPAFEIPKKLSLQELALLLNCPFSFWLSKIKGFRPPLSWESALSPYAVLKNTLRGEETNHHPFFKKIQETVQFLSSDHTLTWKLKGYEIQGSFTSGTQGPQILGIGTPISKPEQMQGQAFLWSVAQLLSNLPGVDGPLPPTWKDTSPPWSPWTLGPTPPPPQPKLSPSLKQTLLEKIDLVLSGSLLHLDKASPPSLKTFRAFTLFPLFDKVCSKDSSPSSN